MSKGRPILHRLVVLWIVLAFALPPALQRPAEAEVAPPSALAFTCLPDGAAGDGAAGGHDPGGCHACPAPCHGATLAAASPIEIELDGWLVALGPAQAEAVAEAGRFPASVPRAPPAA